MKLFEVLTPPPVVVLTEGYTFTQKDGSYVLDYDPSSPGQDDEIMSKRMSGLRSKKVGTRMKMDPAVSAKMDNMDVFSRKEREEFKPYRDDDTFLTSIPIFYGLSLDKGKQRTEQRFQYHRILDALKGRDGHSTTPAAMNQMMQQATRSVMKQIGQYYRAMEKADNIVIIPVPSSSTIPMDFAKTLAAEFGANGKVTTINDILEQNLNYKVGVAGGKNMDPDKLENLYSHVLDDYVRGARTEDQVLDFIEDAQSFVKRQINDPNTSEQDIRLYRVDYEFLKELENEFFNMDGQQQPGQARQRRVHDIRGALRRHVYDRVKLKKGAKAPKRTDNTIYVLVDDNIDQGRTVVDVYRYLYKKDLFNQPGTKVIGAVMHKLGTDLKR